MTEKQIREDVKNSVDMIVDMAAKNELQTEPSTEEVGGSLLPGKTVEEKLNAFEKFLDESPRKFRRKFVQQTFAERMFKNAAKKI